MEEKSFPSNHADIDANGIVRSTRDLPPAHYTFQIKNFSLILESEKGKCRSGHFEVGGYQWRLVLRANGEKNSNGSSHISLYLAIANTNDLSLGWEVNANIRFFVFDQIRDKYLCIQDVDGSVRRFHNLKTKWGFAQLLSHITLNDPSNGYLVDDTCVFGVEVFVIKRTGKGECLSMINQAQRSYFTWRIDKYSALTEESYLSDRFIVEGRRWMLKLYPKGNGCSSEADAYLSLYLMLDDSESVPPKRKLYAKYKIRIRDQVHCNHSERTSEFWFSDSSAGYGFPNFLSVMDLKDTSKGYLVGDCLFVECKIDVVSAVKDFS